MASNIGTSFSRTQERPFQNDSFTPADAGRRGARISLHQDSGPSGDARERSPSRETSPPERRAQIVFGTAWAAPPVAARFERLGCPPGNRIPQVKNSRPRFPPRRPQVLDPDHFPRVRCPRGGKFVTCPVLPWRQVCNLSGSSAERLPPESNPPPASRGRDHPLDSTNCAVQWGCSSAASTAMPARTSLTSISERAGRRAAVVPSVGP